MGAICAFSLEGTVLAADADSGTIFFQDYSGTEILQTSLAGQSLMPGQRIRLCGTNYVTSTDVGVSLGKNPVIDNDGRHSKNERVATVYLKTGRYPIQVLWFNNTGDSFLDLAYSGPNISRQTIPDAKLFRSTTASTEGAISFTNGLSYRAFEGQWQVLPSFQTLPSVKTGVAANFDLNAKTRSEYAGLIFEGFIEIETNGFYTFYLTSDDGSQFFMLNNPVQVTMTGEGVLPAPRQIAVKQPIPGKNAPFWAEVEGQVTFLGRQQRFRDELELTSDDAHMRVVVGDTLQNLPTYLLGSRMRLRGICPESSDIDGHRLADTLVIPNWKSVQVFEVKPDFWLAAKNMTIRDGQSSNRQLGSDIVRIRGQFKTEAPGQLPDLEDATGSIPVELLNSLPAQSVGEVECLGVWNRNRSNSVLQAAIWRQLPRDQGTMETNHLPILTTAAQVQQLSSEEAKRGYRVKLEGVVTWVTDPQNWIVLQDSTHGVSVVGLRPKWVGDAPKVGEKLEIQGTCFPAGFSPVVIFDQAKRLGMGRPPLPIHPTWEQLIGGSMDAQYVEINGLVTASLDDNHLTLLTTDGKIEVEFYPTPTSPLASFVNSQVSIRGVVFANWDSVTHLVTTDHPLRFGNAVICVENPAPVNQFSADQMRARQLMQFDVQRNTFQRVKVFGQLLNQHAGEYYMADNGFGWRVEPAQMAHFDPGDTLEVVGLVKLGEASPVLREAIARKTGHASLPLPVPLVFDQTNAIYDSSRVWVEGLLLSDKENETERVLEIQSGLKHFIARMPTNSGTVGRWPVGSRLKLTGVFSDVGGSSERQREMNAFELLLNSPADVELLARPPWWTLTRLLWLMTLLIIGLALAFIWIQQLRRQVERRSNQLKQEISERQRLEQERAIEQERSRIALDLHDDLGSRLTAINMLAMTRQGTKPTAEASRERLQLIAEKTSLIVTTLDGLVWAVDPKNDTVAALAEYLASFTEEFLARTGIACGIELPPEFPHQIIAAEARHNTLLAVREALNNAVRHGRPSEVRLELKFSERELIILIQDNGCGFDSTRITPGNGLANLHERMRKANGHCRISSTPRNGTSVWLTLPI
ncbi:MAG TPA: sensor histidine kinase [Verrucomicrobiae bacterium]